MYIAIPFLKQQIAAAAPHKHTLSPHFARKNALSDERRTGNLSRYWWDCDAQTLHGATWYM